MACDPNTLIEQAKCYECALTGDMYLAVEIILLCAIRDGTPLTCSPQALVSLASCIRCIPIGMMQAVKTSLLVRHSQRDVRCTNRSVQCSRYRCRCSCAGRDMDRQFQ